MGWHSGSFTRSCFSGYGKSFHQKIKPEVVKTSQRIEAFQSFLCYKLPMTRQKSSKTKGASQGKLSPLVGHIDEKIPLNDELGRSTFAEGISKLILAHPNNSCTILGIEGAWGTGKSYTIELIRRILSKNNKVKWITFNPWYFTDREHLARLLLTTLANELKPESKYEWVAQWSRRGARFLLQ